MESDKIENVAQMICHANGANYDNMTPGDQTRIKMWAESIVVYLTG